MDIEDCIDYASNVLNVDEARAELLRINTQRQHLLWYVADLIHERESKKEGNYLVVRWQCVRDDLKQKYIDEAMQTVTAWWLDEESARASRDEIRIL